MLKFIVSQALRLTFMVKYLRASIQKMITSSFGLYYKRGVLNQCSCGSPNYSGAMVFARHLTSSPNSEKLFLYFCHIAPRVPPDLYRASICYSIPETGDNWVSGLSAAELTGLVRILT